VGVGSGAMSYIGGRIYNNTFSLDDYKSRIASGRTAVAKAGRPYSRIGRMRYRFVTDLFGLRLDYRARASPRAGVPEESRWHRDER